jgi:hypothetical protein
MIESDTIYQLNDSLNINKKNPTKALLFSAVIPGLGQAYNNKYWKIPIIYSALGGVGYTFNFYNKQYQKYLNGLKEILDHETDTSVQLTIFDETIEKATVIEFKEAFRRNRDLSALVFLAFYALNIIDATVDAHLSDFDINDNLTLNVSPEFAPYSLMSTSNYFCLSFSLKIK